MKPSIYTIVLSRYSIEKALKLIQETGGKYIELMGQGWAGSHVPPSLTIDEAKKLKNLIDDLGLECIALSTYVGKPGFSKLSEEQAEKELKDYRHYLKIAEVLECNAIRVVPGGPSPHEASREEWKRSVKYVQKCADMNPEVNVLLEVHYGSLVEDADSCLKYLQLVNRDNVGLIYDPANLFIAKLHKPEVDYSKEFIKKTKDKIFHVHAKNVVKAKNEKGFELTYLDKGSLDYREILRLLKDAGYRNYVSIEYHVLDKSLQKEILIKDFNALKKILERI